MTCREFKDSAAALPLWELSRRQDEGILSHAQQCASCGGWLREQRTLAASLQTLQARTAGLEAGPEVERALLRAFRQSTAPNVAVVALPSSVDSAWDGAPNGVVEEHLSSLPSLVTPGSAPLALRLSRFFEIGAYVAVAAAIVVGMFLGVRLLQHSSRTVPVQTRTLPNSTRPRMQKPVAAAQTPTTAVADLAKLVSADTHKHVTGAARSRVQPAHPNRETTVAAQQVAAEESQVDPDAGYVALMFCDPLSCSADSQVVRMELPASASAGGQNSQPQIADVVVGYDGVVRAVRLVN